MLTVYWHEPPILTSKEVRFERAFKHKIMADSLATTTLLRNQVIEAFAHPTQKDLPIVAVERYLGSLFGVITAIKTGNAQFAGTCLFEWGSPLCNNAKFAINSIDYEAVMVLMGYAYALGNAAIVVAGPLQSQDEPQNADEISKEVVTLFRRAAGVFEWIGENPLKQILPTPTRPPELCPQFVSAMADISLGQAQLLAIQRGRFKQNSPSLLAKLSMGAASKFETARFKMQNEVPAEWAALPLPFREFVQASELHTKSLSLRFMAQLASDETRGGDAVAYLQAAIDTLAPIAQMRLQPYLSSAINLEKTETLRLLEVAKRDNDSIYFARVPSIATLPQADAIYFSKSIPYMCPSPIFTEIK